MDKDFDSPIDTSILPKQKKEDGRAVFCTRHPKPQVMKPTAHKEKDGTVVKHFTCTRCWLTVQETPEIREYLDGGKDINKEMYGDRVF